jgi:hypothetical protein
MIAKKCFLSQHLDSTFSEKFEHVCVSIIDRNWRPNVQTRDVKPHLLFAWSVEALL